MSAEAIRAAERAGGIALRSSARRDLDELLADQLVSWPGMLAALRESGVPLGAAGDPPSSVPGLIGAAFSGLGKALSAISIGPNTTVVSGGTAVPGGISLTVKNPSGASVFVLFAMSGYGSAGGAQAELYLQIDGDNWANRHVGHYYFNAGSDHRTFLGLWMGTLAAGSHTVNPVVSSTQASWQFDANDWLQLFALELP